MRTNGETLADTKAAPMQKNAIKCRELNCPRGDFVQTMKPAAAPAARTTQRAVVQALSTGTCIPAHKKATINRLKKRWSYLQRQMTITSSRRNPAR